MRDNFDLKKFLVENRLGAYSKTANPVNEEDYDLKRDLIGALGSNPTVDDVAKHLNKSYDEAERLMKSLGMSLYASKYGAKGGFRQNYAQQDRADRERKALQKIDNERGSTAKDLKNQATLSGTEKEARFKKIGFTLRSIASKANDFNHFKNIVKKYAEKAGATNIAGAEVRDKDFEEGGRLFDYWQAYVELYKNK